jgi:hypothetical protein
MRFSLRALSRQIEEPTSGERRSLAMSNMKVAASALLCVLTLNVTTTTAVVAACEGGGEEKPNFFLVPKPLLYNHADEKGLVEIFNGGGPGSIVDYNLNPGTALKITSGSNCIKEYQHAENCFVGILATAKPKTPPTKYTEEFLASDSEGRKYSTLIKVEL